jgi:hypothetical protein
LLTIGLFLPQLPRKDGCSQDSKNGPDRYPFDRAAEPMLEG